MISKVFNKNLISYTSKQIIDIEAQFGCHNYGPISVVASKGKGALLWDVEGKQYFDLVGGIGACNQGHCHPKILEEFIDQAQKLTHTGRVIYHDQLAPLEKRLNELFGYDKSVLMNGGVESGETAVKYARRWGYNVKKVPQNKAEIVFPTGNFWGRTIAACGSSDDPLRYKKFGPFDGLGFSLVEYDNVEALENKFKSSPNIVAYFTEPIQGEKGVIIPKKGYLREVQKLCKQYNILFICDEVQTGFGRTGKFFGFEHDEVRPDMVCLGKSMSGGFMPISAVLANNEIMDQIKPGEHGSTFGGNPLAARTALAALNVVFEEKLVENSAKMGKIFLQKLRKIFDSEGRNGKHIKEVRGVGLFLAIEFHEETLADSLSRKLLANGVIAKPTHKTILKMTPPLVLTEEQVNKICEIFEKSWNEIDEIKV